MENTDYILMKKLLNQYKFTPEDIEDIKYIYNKYVDKINGQLCFSCGNTINFMMRRIYYHFKTKYNEEIKRYE